VVADVALQGQLERNLAEAGVGQLEGEVLHQVSVHLSRSEVDHLSVQPSLTSRLNRQSAYSVWYLERSWSELAVLHRPFPSPSSSSACPHRHHYFHRRKSRCGTGHRR
jgi:hypothetical protein